MTSTTPIRVAVVSGLVLLTGCAGSRLAGPAGQPVADPPAFVTELRGASAPGQPEQITFDWTLDERGSRVRGRGVVRVEAPERIRLDLFGARGETYLTAALVGEEYRLPGSAPAAVPLPSPSLLWAALGVLEPPPDATLLSATADSAGADVRYETEGGEIFAYTFRSPGGEPARLVRLERAGRQGVLESVTVDRGEQGRPTRARYRDWANYRDLTLDVQSIRPSAPFPTSIWRPDAATQ